MQGVLVSGHVIEWFEVEPGKVIVARVEGASLHLLHPLGGPDPFASPMEGAGSPATTRNLLDGVLGYVQKTYRISEPRPPLTPLRWVWRLAGYYHSTTETAPLMANVAERFEAGGRAMLANYARLKELDEYGHDVLALHDLRNMGYPAEEVVKVLVPPTAKTLVDYFRRTVFQDDPVEAVGYTYAVERLAISVSESYIDEVDEMLGPGVSATHCLRVHSSVGADVEHVEDALDVIVQLPASDRIRIARTVYEVARLMFTVPEEGHLSEEALEEMLSVFQSQTT